MTGNDVIVLCLFFGMIFLALCALPKKRRQDEDEKKREEWNELAQDRREQISRQLWRNSN